MTIKFCSSLKFIALTVFLLAFNNTFAQKDTSICTKKGPKATSQRIREKIYQNIREIKVTKSSDTFSLRKEYMDIQVEMNVIYELMKDDLTLLSNKKRICEKYLDQLKPELLKANQFNEKLLKTLEKNTGTSGLGSDDLLSIIDWIVKNAKEYGKERKAEFYNALAWKDWDKIN